MGTGSGFWFWLCPYWTSSFCLSSIIDLNILYWMSFIWLTFEQWCNRYTIVTPRAGVPFGWLEVKCLCCIVIITTVLVLYFRVRFNTYSCHFVTVDRWFGFLKVGLSDLPLSPVTLTCSVVFLSCVTCLYLDMIIYLFRIFCNSAFASWSFS